MSFDLAFLHDRKPRGTGKQSMRDLIGGLDWSTTPVGPAAQWPQSLRTALSMLLDSLYPMLILWGPEYVQFYNEAHWASAAESAGRRSGRWSGRCSTA